MVGPEERHMRLESLLLLVVVTKVPVAPESRMVYVGGGDLGTTEGLEAVADSERELLFNLVSMLITSVPSCQDLEIQ